MAFFLSNKIRQISSYIDKVLFYIVTLTIGIYSIIVLLYSYTDILCILLKTFEFYYIIINLIIANVLSNLLIAL